MSEKIFLTYTNATAVPYQGSVLGYHIVLNYIDSNGVHHTLQGIPEHRFDRNIDKLGAFVREEMFSDGANNRDSPFQRLQTKANRDRDISLNQPHTMVAQGDDLSSRWALMQDFADEVNSIGYEYRPRSQNSNSFAGEALQRAGFFGSGTEFPERFDNQLVFDPVIGETQSFRVPGFEKPLANPFNAATPMPFPLGAPAAPLVPTNRFPAPDGANSFDNGFGNWGSVPTGGFGDAPSRVWRGLERYRRSAAPDGPASTSAQGAPPATPAFQPDAVYSPAGDFFGNFPRVSALAVAPSPTAFNESGSSSGPRMAADFNALAQGVGRLLSGAGQFVGSSPITPAEGASPSGRLVPRSTAPNLPSEESAFGDRPENAPRGRGPDISSRLHSRRVSSAFPDITPPNPDQPVQPQRSPPLGIFGGKPMSQWLLPPSVWGLPDNADAGGNGDWFTHLAGIAFRNPTQPAPSLDCATSTLMTRHNRGPFNVCAGRGSLPPPGGADRC